VVAVLVAVVRDCDGDNNGDSKLRFPGLDTACNKINIGQSMYNTIVCHYRIKHYIIRHILKAEFRQISERKISM
jgi:hypothetical protein